MVDAKLRSSGPAPAILAGPDLVAEGRVPENLRPHFARLGIDVAVQAMLDTVRQVYPDAEKIELSVVRDEYGDERVKVNAFVPDEGEMEAEKYFACLRQWNDALAAAEKIVFTTF